MRWFLLSVRPYRTVEDKIGGVVITCVDINSNKAGEEALRTANLGCAVRKSGCGWR